MSKYDAIVVGARVAGSPTAMLLARKGYRVLLVDRATFPSDAISTHLIHAPGMAALRRWGLADEVIATGCPPVPRYRLDLGELVIVGTPRGAGPDRHAYAPRRTILDKILVDAASQAGAELREGFSVESLIVEDGVVRGVRGHSSNGRAVEERARVVIGADGVNSPVARSVGAAKYNEVPAIGAMYYSYWSGITTDEFELYGREDRGFAALPTNDDHTIVLVAWPIEQFASNKRDLEGNYLRSLEAEPAFGERIKGASRESRIVGAHMDSFYRQPYGAGWALVGDAGYHKDATTAQGITDAFRDAEALAGALDDVFSGRRREDEALADYQATRDRGTMPMYELTQQFAGYEPPTPDEQELFAVVGANLQAADDFASMIAGTMRVEEFFDSANVARYLGDSDPTPAAALEATHSHQ
jgi:flavin-dependent dehydrogenase